jgi:S1-C subfamily serine protease
VIERATSIEVRLTDGRLYEARVCGEDAANDLALLKVDASGLPTVKVGDSHAVQVGAHLFVIGNPKGLENTLTDGLLSSRRVWGDGVGSPRALLQISAPISPGSSGSPVFNSKGLVIGIAKSALLDGQNLNFAVPVQYVADLLLKWKGG